MLINTKIDGRVDRLTDILERIKAFEGSRLDPVYRAMIEMHMRAAAYEINEALMYIELESKTDIEPRKRVSL